MVMKTTTNIGKNQKKFSRNANRKGGSQLNHNLFCENFVYDPLDVSSEPMRTINIRTMRLDLKKNKITKSEFFFQIMNTIVIEVIKHIVRR